MARPERVQIVPSEDRAAYETWRQRVLSWPAPVEASSGLRVGDMPAEYQERLIRQLLVAKALRSGPDHWSRAIVEVEDQ